MGQTQNWLERADLSVTTWMSKHGVTLLRISLGIVFLWFGVLKFLPKGSPAEELAGKTIAAMTLGVVQPAVSLPMLAAWESVIGLGLIVGGRGGVRGWIMRGTLLLLFLQMPGTLMPLFLFPSECFTRIPWAPTLEGQYIIKNLVLISAGILLGATVRGGDVVRDPDLAEEHRARLR